MTPDTNNRTAQTAAWDTIIRPTTGRGTFRTRELFAYTDLIGLLVKRDFAVQYKQTILGPLWHVVQPLLTTAVFTVAFGQVAGISTNGLPGPLFYLSGIVLWSFFQGALLDVSGVFLRNSHLFSRVYFPRLTVPIATVLSRHIAFGVQLAVFLVLYSYYFATTTAVRPTLQLLLLPLILLQLALLALACGLLIASVSAKYRDLQYLTQFGMQLWMFASPVVYPASEIPEKWQWILHANPAAHGIELFRNAWLGSGDGNIFGFFVSFLVTVLLAAAGIAAFNAAEQTVVDRV